MSQLVLYVSDLVAVGVLVFGLYFPRHRRRDLVVAYLGVNVGVLSIIRLRSTELDQHEVAYYFSSLALGILGALASSVVWRPVGMMALILTVMFVGDHPRLLRGYRHQVLVLDSAVASQVALVARLEQVLGARVYSASVQRLDLVNDTTVVEVRYAQRRGAQVGAGVEVARGAGR